MGGLQASLSLDDPGAQGVGLQTLKVEWRCAAGAPRTGSCSPVGLNGGPGAVVAPGAPTAVRGGSRSRRKVGLEALET
jgi:hypothetical protein